MPEAGVQLINWFGMACELHRDWRNDVEGMGGAFFQPHPQLSQPDDQLFQQNQIDPPGTAEGVQRRHLVCRGAPAPGVLSVSMPAAAAAAMARRLFRPPSLSGASVPRITATTAWESQAVSGVAGSRR